MNTALKSIRDIAQPSPLVELLERELEPSAPSPEAARVPAKVLERVLLGPARHVLCRPGKELRAQLIRVSYQLAGGRGEPPHPLPYIVEILHAGSLVIDDIEDGSEERRGAPALHRVVGTPLAINTGNWLYFWPLELIAELGLSAHGELEAHRQFAHTMCRAHRGQALDLGIRVTELAQHELAQVARATAELKTGALLAFGARLGALCAHAPEPRVEALARFGRELGVSLQRLDDLGGITSARMRDKGLEDLQLERVTFAWAVLAERLDACTFKRLVYQLRADKSPEGLDTLRELLAQHMREHDALGEVRAKLWQAFDALRGALEVSGGALERLREHIARLEVSYV
nr:polyprenyl synthase [uncultured bacterium]ANY58044.1 polyprenyl synthase [uncultured bacterium]